MSTSKHQRNIGLFFGSFNPIHVGHLIIANYVLEHSDLREIWLVVTPHNPHKKRSTLANDYVRLELARLGIADHPKIRVSDIEFNLPKPSYTVHTLAYLRDKYPNYGFSLLMGGDNLVSLPRWKNYETIIEHHHIYVYNRPGHQRTELADHHHVHFIDAPMIQLSASLIRQMIREGKSVRYMVPDTVYNYIDMYNLYR